MPEWFSMTIRDMATLYQPDQIRPRTDALTRFAGVRWYGAGLFVREERASTEIKGKCYALKSGTLVYNRLFAWKQAFATVPGDFDGIAVSNEFPQFDVEPDLATPEYLALYCSTPTFAAKVLELSTGSTAISRNRLKEDDFLGMPVLCPPVPIQRRIVEIVDAVDRYVDTLITEESSLSGMLATVRQSLLSDCPRVPLHAVCEIQARLVNPLEERYADMPHIGVDSIEKYTGRILGVRSAREDNVISGKYLVGKGEVVYSKIRPNLRKVAYPGYVSLCSADAYPLAPREDIPPSLLREVLLEDSFTSQVVALSTRLKMPKVNRRELFSTTVAMPSNRKDRLHVARTLDGIRIQLDAVISEIAELQTARAALLDAMLTRKIEIAL